MKKYLLLYASYSDVDYEMFVDCLGIYDTREEAEKAEAVSRNEDDADGTDRIYHIKEMTIK